MCMQNQNSLAPCSLFRFLGEKNYCSLHCVLVNLPSISFFRLFMTKVVRLLITEFQWNDFAVHLRLDGQETGAAV